MASSRKFHVFLSFRGEDTRVGFTGHLYAALKRKGIDSFIDSNLEKGNDLSVLLRRIEQSMIALVVFSENYSNSSWCLDEVTKIWKCRKKDKQVVIPIFYGVSTSDVKNLTGKFGDLFELSEEKAFFENPDRVREWKVALNVVSNIDGFVWSANRLEPEFIDEIVNHVLKLLKNMNSGERKGIFGIQPRIAQLEEKLDCGLGGVRIIGVLGMSGIGKTTLVDCLYERLKHEFDGREFCRNIREESERHGLVKLQRKLLEKLLEDDNLEIGHPEGAHEALKERLLNKKLLIVLDDVNKKDQIEYLLGQAQNWLKKGSRVIITTRDKKFIKGLVHDTLVVQRLDNREALQQFYYHAFDGCCNDENFMDLSKEFVDYTKGNPYALKLLGRDLRQKNRDQWAQKLAKLQQCPDGEIQKILRIGYEELSQEQKDVFLDIACFFRSENKYYLISLLDGNVKDSISDLEDKFMITISDDRVEMHDLWHTIGKDIGSEASVKKLGERCRLWNHRGICLVLKNKLGSENVKGIFLDMAEVENMYLSSEAFARMCNLRYLKIYNSRCTQGCEPNSKLCFPEGLRFPFEGLRYLHWQGFPLDSLPLDFNVEDLVDLKLPYSKVKQLWSDDKSARKLEWINLDYSLCLCDLSGLWKAPNLKRLSLEGCTSLEALPMSIKDMNSLAFLNLRNCTCLRSLPEGISLNSLETLILSGCSKLQELQLISGNLAALYLDDTAIAELPATIEKLQKLVLLNLKNCTNLKFLPLALCKLTFLQELILSGCSSLESFPEVEGDMRSLEILLLDGTAIKEMPTRLDFSNLKIFSFCGSKVPNPRNLLAAPLSGFSCLRELCLSDCGLSKCPDGIDHLTSLKRLCLSRNDVKSLHESINKLYYLKWLDLKYCQKLKSLPLLPPNLQYLDAHGCGLLEMVSSPLALFKSVERIHSSFIFTNCHKLNHIALDYIIAYAQSKSQLMANALKRDNGSFILEPLVSACFPGHEVPSWFSHRTVGSILEPRLPPHWCDDKFIGVALCAVVSFTDYKDHTNRFSVKCNCKIKNEDGSLISFSCNLGFWADPGNEPRKIESDHVFIGYTSCLHVMKCHRESQLNRCGHTMASFRFYMTNDAPSDIAGCEVVNCGLNLFYAAEESDNQLKLPQDDTCYDANWATRVKRDEHLNINMVQNKRDCYYMDEAESSDRKKAKGNGVF